MAHETKAETKNIVEHLPVLVVSPADVGRLLRELETLDATLLDRTLRKSGKEANMLKASQLMDQTVELNKLNLLHDADRLQLRQFLQNIKNRAPVLHMSFSSDPSPAFLSKLMTWLRREIHPQILVTIGLQPSIGAGCIVRSTNRHFDFSLRQDFAKKRDLLLSKLIPDAKGAKP